MEIIGFILAVLIGLSLGLIGGGGSILTVPILVYVIGLTPVISTSYSLFIVGTTALVGAFDYFRNKQLNIKAALVFSMPSLAVVFLTRKFLLPAIPDKFYLIEFQISKGLLIMIVFAILMLFSSVSMIRQKKEFRKLGKKAEQSFLNYPLLFFEGIIVGLLTGLVGAGGGFLIIPALVLFGGLPMKTAIGTSLLIIAINSLIGFSGDLLRGAPMDWLFLLSFSCFAFTGIILGSYLSRYIQGSSLKPAFGWFTLCMGIFIILKELFIMY